MTNTNPTAGPAESSPYARQLVTGLTFEVIPISTIDEALAALPPSSPVSVTCSPAKGIDATIRLSERIRDLGHSPIPHLAARMVDGPAHVATLAKWFRNEGVGQAFIVGGDANPPAHYHDAATFLDDLLAADPGLTTIGVTAYPDGHAAISNDALHSALHHKQASLAAAGVDGYASTQMCFDPASIVQWLTAERAAGLELPIHLGMAGVVDRSKLMSMGVRLGIGTSLSFLKKNRRAIGSLLTKADYNPDTLLKPLASQLETLGVTGLHCFTFNQVAATEIWRREYLANG